MAYRADALSEPTKRACERRQADLAVWCRWQSVDRDEMPVHPVLIAAYLGKQAKMLGKNALDVRVAAIAHERRARGHTWFGRHPAIRARLRGVRRNR